MLPKKYRLAMRGLAPKFWRNGRWVRGDIIDMIVQSVEPRAQSSPSQFGFVMSKKVSHKAVMRNRGKRLMREAVRSFLPKIKPGHMVVFTAKKEIAGKSLAEVKKTVESLLKSLF